MSKAIKAQLDLQYVSVIEVFDDVYVIVDKKQIGISANTILIVNGTHYKVVAVSFANEQIYLRLEEEL